MCHILYKTMSKNVTVTQPNTEMDHTGKHIGLIWYNAQD